MGKNEKKNKSIFFLILLLILIIIVLFIMARKNSSENNKEYNPASFNQKIYGNILDGFYNYDSCSYNMIHDIYEYHIYYYEEISDNNFINNENYVLVDEDNIEELQKILNKIKSYYIKNKKCDKLYEKFNVDIISIGDYTSIKDTTEYYDSLETGCNKDKYYCTSTYTFIVYLYDIETHSLYYLRQTA